MTGGAQETAEAARRRERRAAVRQHHPDRGGDPAVLQATLAAIDARYAGPGDRPRPEVGRGAVPHEAQDGVVARLRDGVRVVRERIPAGWPGHRRLIDVPPRRHDRD